MAPPPEQGPGAGEAAEPAAAARHERELSASSSSLSSSSSSASTNYLPASNKLSSESIPYPGDLAKFSSFSSTSSYESFFHIEASDLGAAANDFLDFEPCTAAATRPPGLQTMVSSSAQAQHKHHHHPDAAAAAAGAYDPKRLPSSMFRTRSTSPAEWSVTSNESLFSIQLSNPADADLSAIYADLYYDAAGLPRFPSMGRDHHHHLKLPSLSESSAAARSGGLCVRHDCSGCNKQTRKSVRFATTESVSTDGKHSVVVSTLEVAMEEEKAPAPAAKAAGWCELGCCWPSPQTAWWHRCCGCGGCGCQC